MELEFQILDKTVTAGSNRSLSEQGYLTIKDCVLARSGVFEYLASEFQPKAYNDRDPNSVILVYRSAQTLEAAAPGFSGAPLTNDHPPVMLDAMNTNKFQTGHVNGGVRVAPDPEAPNEKVMLADLVATDASQIAAIQQGKAELSNGYYSRYDFNPGVAPSGKRYDCEQHTIRPNHVAVVDAGRCGPLCKVSDALPDTKTPKEEIPMSTVTINGVSYEASEQVVQAVAQLQAQLAELQAAAPTPETIAAETAATVAQEEQMATLQTQLEEAQAATTPDALDEAVEERTEVVDAARKLVPNFDHKGKSNEAIRLEVVKAKCGEIANIDKAPAAYVHARFDALAATAPKNALDAALGESLRTTDSKHRGGKELPNTDAARAAAVDKRQNAWKKQK